MKLKKLLRRKALLEDFIRSCESRGIELYQGQVEEKKQDLEKVNQQIEALTKEDK